MSSLTIYNDGDTYTSVPNRFIDEYMIEANDAQIKVYLYLLRVFHAHRSTSISDIADKFNHTEKDVLRSLKYWEKKKLLSLEYDDDKNLTAIHMTAACPEDDHAGLAQGADIVPIPASKPSYSLDELKSFRDNEETSQLLFIVEQYIGKPLSVSEIKSIYFLYDKLGFSADLIDYLVQYCVGKGKSDFRYIEKVALNWHDEQITTPGQAKAYVGKYDKTVYTVMKALGKTNAPTPKEVTFITRWTKEYGFTTDIIAEACERTVMATDKHRFEYADSILSNWNRSNVHCLEDIRNADSTFKRRKNTASKPAAILNNQFNQFPQRDYDFDALEKELLSN